MYIIHWHAVEQWFTGCRLAEPLIRPLVPRWRTCHIFSELKRSFLPLTLVTHKSNPNDGLTLSLPNRNVI